MRREHISLRNEKKNTQLNMETSEIQKLKRKKFIVEET